MVNYVSYDLFKINKPNLMFLTSYFQQLEASFPCRLQASDHIGKTVR